MGFDYALEGEQYLAARIPGPPSNNYYYSRVFGEKPEHKDKDVQLFGGWLRITAGQAVPFPKSGGIESGVVVKGELTITDESGKTTTLREGESFYIQRGSIITWSAERFALMYKCSAYPPGSQP